MSLLIPLGVRKLLGTARYHFSMGSRLKFLGPMALSIAMLIWLLTGCTSNKSASPELTTSDQISIQPPLVEEPEFNRARKSVYLDIDDLTGSRVIRHNNAIKQFEQSAVIIKREYIIHVEAILKEKANAEWEFEISSFYVGPYYINHYRFIFSSQDQRLTLDISEDQRKEQKWAHNWMAENSNVILNQKEAIAFCKIVEMDSAYMLFEGTTINSPKGDIPNQAKLIYKDMCTVYFGLLNDLKP